MSTHILRRIPTALAILFSGLIALLGAQGCTSETASKAGSFDEVGAPRSFLEDVSPEDCFREDETDLLLGTYTDTFESFSENQELVLTSDADGGLATTIALVLIGTAPDSVSQITVTVALDDETVGEVIHDHFEGFCTAELNWLIPNLGLSFHPGISLFDLTDQTATLNVNLLFTDDTSATFQAQVVFTP